MDLCAFREFGVSPTDTFLFSLLLMFNISVSQLVLGRKDTPGQEAQQGKSHTRGRSHLTDTLQSQCSCSALQWLPALSLSLLMDARQQESRSQGICAVTVLPL